ncbi:MAG TPA: PHB depolymerase family esterase [Thermodesulfobacteriota bacterium]|nr:PHB depolymerase family esterase [Thermodesulfobacteriota bacterium]
MIEHKSLRRFLLIVVSLGLAFFISYYIAGKDKAYNVSDNASLDFGGIKRTYRIHVPTSYDRTKPVPLLLVFHGLGGSGREMEVATGFNELSDRRGFLVVYPDGYEASWADGSGATPAGRAGVDDVGFVSALIDKLGNEFRIDSGRVYATGYSNGGMFVQRLACELSQKITAVASVAGTMAEKLSTSCNPGRAVSVMHVHGTEDSIVPWQGGEVRGVGISGWRILSIPTTVSKWSDINGCPKSSEEDYIASNNRAVKRKTYSGCRDSTEVVLYGIIGGGHNWPRLMKRTKLTESHSSEAGTEIYAEELIWNFFEKYSKK